MSPFAEICKNKGGKMNPIVKEFKNMKYVDLTKLDAFEAVSIGAVLVLSVTTGVLMASNLYA